MTGADALVDAAAMQRGTTADVLVLAADGGSTKPLTNLLAELQHHHVYADAVGSVAAAREAFFAAGGHGLVVVTPDVAPGVARHVVDSLRAIDPHLAVLVFGREQLRHLRDARTIHADGFHLTSRAGVGAVLKAVRGA